MQFLKMVLASVVGYLMVIVVAMLILVGIVSKVVSSAKPKVEIPSNGVLELSLNYLINDQSNENDPEAVLSTVLDPNAEVPVGLNDILRCIEFAKTDDKIKGIVMDLTVMQAGYAKVQEIRNKLEEFKKTGKFIYAYSDYYYYTTYYLASVADSVFINPQGEILYNGITAQVSFFSEMLKKIGVEMQVVKVGKYKGAVESFSRTSLSPENKEQIQAYINSIYDNTLEQISKSRGISVEKLKSDADGLLMRNNEDFLKGKYVDATLFKDQFYELVKRKSGVPSDEQLELISPIKYVKSVKKVTGTKDKIAVIFASGSINGGKGDGSTIAAEDMAATLKEVREDEDIKAVVFRINSPGGGSLASDIIWREAKLLAETKPLVVSMGDVAASGGYYIASCANKIFAEPTTITGSIGVFGLVPNAQNMLNNKLGVNLEYVGTGSNSDLGRIDKPLSPQHRQYIQQFVDRVYDVFLQRVAEGRKMTTAQVHEIAQGRVWTGTMAKEIGLVDELGGLEMALAEAAKMAKIKAYKTVNLPKAKDPFSTLMKKINGDVSILSQLSNTELAEYLYIINEFSNQSTKPTVQMRMPFNIEVASLEPM